MSHAARENWERLQLKQRIVLATTNLTCANKNPKSVLLLLLRFLSHGSPWSGVLPANTSIHHMSNCIYLRSGARVLAVSRGFRNMQCHLRSKREGGTPKKRDSDNIWCLWTLFRYDPGSTYQAGAGESGAQTQTCRQPAVTDSTTSRTQGWKNCRAEQGNRQIGQKADKLGRIKTRPKTRSERDRALARQDPLQPTVYTRQGDPLAFRLETFHNLRKVSSFFLAMGHVTNKSRRS